MLQESGCGQSCTFTLIFLRELAHAMCCALKRRPNFINSFDAQLRYWSPHLMLTLRNDAGEAARRRMQNLSHTIHDTDRFYVDTLFDTFLCFLFSFSSLRLSILY